MRATLPALIPALVPARAPMPGEQSAFIREPIVLCRWAKTSSQDDVVFPTCESIIEQRCVELGDGGGQPMFGFIFGSSNGSQPCSGHGKCTTDWQECGSGTSIDSATPCCSCELGFAGVGCAELDARVYIGVGAVAALLVLLVAMLFLSVTSAICRKRIEGDLAQPLMR